MQFINAPTFIDKLLMLMKPFMKKELMEILHVHTPDSKAINNIVPVGVLPTADNLEEYRGHFSKAVFASSIFDIIHSR